MNGTIPVLALSAGVAAALAAAAEGVDLNALLCTTEGWKCDERYASISLQTKHVRGKGPGLLFEYIRESKPLFDHKGRFNNAAYRPRAAKTLPDTDLSGCTQLSFWVYVEGNAEEAFQLGFGSQRPFRLSCRRGEWFHARWYLHEAPADLGRITRVFFAGVNQGSAPGDPDRARIYLSDFRLSATTPALPRAGWAPDPSEIILAYTGAYPGEAVVAVVAAQHAGRPYQLTGNGVQQAGQVSAAKRSARTEFADIAVRAPATPGEYRLAIEDGPSTTLAVTEHPYAEATGKALRLIRAQRCGCASELHGPCHLDDAIRSDTGEPVDVSGGWHDEGVSQYTHLTARTTANLARWRRRHTRRRRLESDADADDPLLAEIEWGVRALLKYDLGNGVHYHSLVAPYWYHTDNQPGSGDERKIKVFHPHQLSCWWRAGALALAAGVCREPLRSQARALAERYWGLHKQVKELYNAEEQKRWESDREDLRITAARLGASVELFRLTGGKEYADDAVNTANKLLTFQEREPAGEDGFRGYFRKRLGSPDPYAGINGKSLDVPGRALAELLMVLPEHPDAPRWREALQLYAEGTLKPLARLNLPYGCVGAGPFREPQTTLFPGEKAGAMVVYPLHLVSRRRKEKELLRLELSRSQPNMAAQLGALGKALNDPELTRMAGAAVRFMLGANQFHVSMMRNFGKRWPENAQLPDVPGSIVGWLGITSEGLPFLDPQGAGRLEGPDRFVVKEGNTAMCSYLLDACSYLDGNR